MEPTVAQTTKVTSEVTSKVTTEPPTAEATLEQPTVAQTTDVTSKVTTEPTALTGPTMCEICTGEIRTDDKKADPSKLKAHFPVTGQMHEECVFSAQKEVERLLRQQKRRHNKAKKAAYILLVEQPDQKVTRSTASKRIDKYEKL